MEKDQKYLSIHFLIPAIIPVLFPDEDLPVVFLTGERMGCGSGRVAWIGGGWVTVLR